tara:strand:- start:2961 stop:3440 length:480 start_codon:yes stop_codon:yes gene_type:complete
VSKEVILAETSAGEDIIAQPLSQFEIIEGLLADCLQEIKRSVDVLFYNPGEMEVHTNAMATRAIALTEVNQVLQMLMGVSSSSLTKRHRMCRDVLRQMYMRMMKNAPENAVGKGFDLPKFGTDLVTFMTTYHKILSAHDAGRESKALWRRFCRGQALPK